MRTTVKRAISKAQAKKLAGIVHLPADLPGSRWRAVN
jgi:hypothetical protein